MKKRFDCGHLGKGQFCHRCKNETDMQQAILAVPASIDQVRIQHFKNQSVKRPVAKPQQPKVKDEAFIQVRAEIRERARTVPDAVDLAQLQHLPLLQKQVLDVLDAMATGADYRSLGGKKMWSEPHENVISVPIGRKYRLLFSSMPLRPISLMSHEDYNKLHNGRVFKRFVRASG